jgi:hypothetical protein
MKKGRRKLTTNNHQLTTILIAFLFLLPICANATIVDISIVTDKPTYQLGEYVTVSITAYNPNSAPVTLGLPLSQPTYLMDGTFNWNHNKIFAPVMMYKTINAYDSWTLDRVHGAYEMSLYPLSMGSHSVVGIVGTYGSSLPVQFEVIPEPATLALIAMGPLFFRVFSKKKS